MGDGRRGGGKPQVKKATFESTKKKEIGVSDLTLLSKVSNEAINDNLKLRFDAGEIYVGHPHSEQRSSLAHCRRCGLIQSTIDIHWPCAGLCQSVPGS